jgi:hypothetical protein
MTTWMASNVFSARARSFSSMDSGKRRRVVAAVSIPKPFPKRKQDFSREFFRLKAQQCLRVWDQCGKFVHDVACL